MLKAILCLTLLSLVLASTKLSCVRDCARQAKAEKLEREAIKDCVKSCFTRKSKNTQELADSESTNSFVVNAPAGVNLRASPCNGRVLAVLPQNTPVTFLGQTQNTCGYNWFNVRTASGQTGWAASSFLSQASRPVQPPPQQPPQRPPQQPPQRPPQQNGGRVYGDIGGLTGPTLQKMQEIANLFGRGINVVSGKRNWGDNQHKVGEAADFHVEGWSDEAAANHLRQNRKILNGCQLIYHVPGSRSCSTGEHLHISRPTGYRSNSFCRERTCNFTAECDFLGFQ